MFSAIKNTYSVYKKSKQKEKQQKQAQEKMKTQAQEKKKKQAQEKKEKQNGLCKCLSRCLHAVLHGLHMILEGLWWAFPILLALGDQFTDLSFVILTWDDFPTKNLRNLALLFASFQTLALSCYCVFIDSKFIFKRINDYQSAIIQNIQQKKNQQAMINSNANATPNPIQSNYSSAIIQNKQQKKIQQVIIDSNTTPNPINSNCLSILYVVRLLLALLFAPIIILLVQLKTHEFAVKYKIELLKGQSSVIQQLNPQQIETQVNMFVKKYNESLPQQSKISSNKILSDIKRIIKPNEQSEIVRLSGILFMICLFNALFESIPELVIQSITNQRMDEWTTIAKISAAFSAITIVYSIIQISRTFRDQYGKKDENQKQYIRNIMKCKVLMGCIYLGIGLIAGSVIFGVYQIEQLWLVIFIMVASSFYGYFALIALLLLSIPIGILIIIIAILFSPIIIIIVIVICICKPRIFSDDPGQKNKQPIESSQTPQITMKPKTQLQVEL